MNMDAFNALRAKCANKENRIALLGHWRFRGIEIFWEDTNINSDPFLNFSSLFFRLN